MLLLYLRWRDVLSITKYPCMSLASIDLLLIYRGQVTLYGNLTRLISYLHCQTTVLLVMTFGYYITSYLFS